MLTSLHQIHFQPFNRTGVESSNREEVKPMLIVMRGGDVINTDLVRRWSVRTDVNKCAPR